MPHLQSAAPAPLHSAPLPPSAILAPPRKSHLSRNPKASAKHPLQRRHIPHIPHQHLALHLWIVTRDHRMPDLRADGVANLERLFLVIVALGAEAVHVYEGEFGGCVRGEEGFMGGVEADEGGEEGQGAGGEVEDVVAECLGGGEGGVRGGEGVFGVARAGGGGDIDGGGGGQEAVGCGADEGAAVEVEGADEVLDLLVLPSVA